MSLGNKQAQEDLIDELIYSSYAYNRRLAQSVAPERWRKVYGDAVEQMERRLKEEVAHGMPNTDLRA